MSNYGYFYKHKDYEIEPSTFIVSKIFAGVIGAGVGYVAQTFASGKVDVLDNWIFAVIFIVLLLVTYIPALSLWLPGLLGYVK